MAFCSPQILAFCTAHGGPGPAALNPGMPSMKPQYANIVCRAILEGKDPVHEMHKWYSIACAYGANPLPPPTLTLSQFNTLRQYAAESDSSMSHLFDAVLEALVKAGCSVEGAITASMEKGCGKKPPVTPTINVYTKDNVIHNVPADKLTEMGPETLASVVAITDEMPWSESRVADFKKQQGKRLDEAAAKKKCALEAEQALAIKVNEDFTSASATATTRMLIVYYGTPVGRKISLSALLQGSGGTHISDVLELIGDGHSHVSWPDCKVMRLNNHIDTKDVERKKRVRKEQIDELVSKLLKERNEL